MHYSSCREEGGGTLRWGGAFREREKVIRGTQSWLHGDTIYVVTQGPAFGLIQCCSHLKIHNNFEHGDLCLYFAPDFTDNAPGWASCYRGN